MPKPDPAPAGRSTRPSASRQLLLRKAVQEIADNVAGIATLEDQFPGAQIAAAAPNGALPENAAEPATGPAKPGSASEPAAAATKAMSAAGAVVTEPGRLWSDKDEKAFQTLLARRKQAGYAFNSAAGSQRLQPGGIKPNRNTIFATIVHLVAERGSITRAELIELMTGTAFPHPKARPSDRGWCQGYVSGAIRNGFLSPIDGADADQQQGG